MVHGAQDKCAFVRRNCHDDEAGLIEYLSFYYCTLGGSAQPVAFVILVIWLGLLFTTIGIAASDFFSVNLSTIATILGLSESLAGVTFLAFGNGSPDVFSTFAAMSSNSGSMAVGELVGAAGFITSVVAGSMALVREFKVSKKTFVRDICFFIVAISFTIGFLSDGHIHLWECCVMIGFYVFYVIFVVGWHAYVKRRKAKKDREADSRSHFYAGATDEIEPYRDDPEDEDTTPGARRQGPTTVDISVLERGPRIAIEHADVDDEDDNDRGHHVATEMASSMRINRRRGKRRSTTITPIRPSLVGVLEFRSVLSSLQEERNMRMAPIHLRRHSHQADVGWSEGGGAAVRGPLSAQTIQGVGNVNVTTRNRALSSGAVPSIVDEDLARPASRSSNDRGVTRSSSAHTIDGKLAPPTASSIGGRSGEGQGMDAPPVSPRILQLRIPSPGQSPSGSEHASPSAFPFPAYTDSPLALTPNQGQLSHLDLPPSGIEQSSEFPGLFSEQTSKPLRWWPYQFFPSPQVLLSTVFPTLQEWNNKSFWDKLLSLISVPSIFLLVITLPVVEGEDNDLDSEESLVDQPAPEHLNNTAIPVLTEPSDSSEPETEWQHYRRSTRSRGSSGHTSPALISLSAPYEPRGPMSSETVRPAPGELDAQLAKPVSDLSSTLDGEDHGWNRWLLILQIFTGPLFSVFIVWANMAEDLDNPNKVLLMAVLISLVCSLVMLAILLLTTTPDRRPKYHFLFCFLGFVIAIAWISTIAGEVVGVLKTLGVILDISEAILGLTIFAVGNSVGDLVADVTVARLGYPVMAL